MAAVHVVVPEGLAAERGPGGEPRLSAPYRAVIETVAREAAPGERVLMAPGNPFGAGDPEEVIAAHTLRSIRSDLRVEVPQRPAGGRYLDTLDNARELKRWLHARGAWPPGPVRLYCNAPHALRAGLVFRLEGFEVGSVRPVRAPGRRPRPVSRLAYMGVPGVHGLYEAAATGYDVLRWLLAPGRRR